VSLIQDVIAKTKEKDPAQPEFHQAVEEVLNTLEPTVEKSQLLRNTRNSFRPRSTSELLNLIGSSCFASHG